MSEHDVRARVAAFVTDFHAAWLRAGTGPRHDDPGGFVAAFEAWGRELDAVAARHLVPGVRTGQEGTMGSRAPHGPDEVLDVVVIADDGRSAAVHSTVPHVVPTYHTYSLVADDDAGWLVSRIESFLDPPGAPLVGPDEAARLLASATDVLGERLDDGDDPSVLLARFPVVPVGSITTSGVLVVRDLGYGDHDLEPLAHRVPAGRYEVETAVDGDLNVALRVVLSTAATRAWCRAAQADGGHVVGVDAGNVSVADLAGLLRLGAQDAERCFADHVAGAGSTGGVVLTLGGDGPTDCALVTSGYGDGGYPAFWGLDADGRPTQLVVDFMVADRGA